MDESFNLSDDSSGPSPGIVRKKKIAIGVIFSLSRDEDENNKFNEFFFSHFPLFESHMNKLKSAIEQVNAISLDPCTCVAIRSPSALSDLISDSCYWFTKEGSICCLLLELHQKGTLLHNIFDVSYC